MTKESLTKLKEGRAIGAQPGFAASWNWVVDWFKRSGGRNGVRITDRGDRWVFEADQPPGGGGSGGGIPTGYEEAQVVVGIDISGGYLRIKTRTGLIKSASTTTNTNAVPVEQYGP